jgi:hypothetical protein
MAYDDPKLPRAVLRGENLYIDGENEPYFRDPEYPVYLEVTDLRISGGFESEDLGKGDRPMQMAAVTLRGRAKLEGKDKFAVAGVETDPSPPIEFQLRQVAENETKFHWRATIGFQMHDWEFENEEGFWVQGYCTGQLFDAIVAVVRTGRVEKLRVGMETMMWTKQKSSGFMPGMPMTFHLVPPVDKDSTRPAIERGTITGITWDESYSLRTSKPAKDDAAPPKPAVVELPARLYSMLGTIIIIGIVIAVLQFPDPPQYLNTHQWHIAISTSRPFQHHSQVGAGARPDHSISGLRRSNCFALRDASFDHLVGGCEERFRHLDAERPGRLPVDDELELGRLYHRQVGRLALTRMAGEQSRRPQFCG